MVGGEKVGRRNFEQHKADPMARTQMQFGSLKPNGDFGSVTIDSRPLIPKKPSVLQKHDFGHKGFDSRAIPTKV